MPSRRRSTDFRHRRGWRGPLRSGPSRKASSPSRKTSVAGSTDRISVGSTSSSSSGPLDSWYASRIQGQSMIEQTARSSDNAIRAIATGSPLSDNGPLAAVGWARHGRKNRRCESLGRNAFEGVRIGKNGPQGLEAGRFLIDEGSWNLLAQPRCAGPRSLPGTDQSEHSSRQEQIRSLRTLAQSTRSQNVAVRAARSP